MESQNITENYLPAIIGNMNIIEPDSAVVGKIYYITDHTGLHFDNLRECVCEFLGKEEVDHALKDTINLDKYYFRVICCFVNGKEIAEKRGRKIKRVPADWGLECIAEVIDINLLFKTLFQQFKILTLKI